MEMNQHIQMTADALHSHYCMSMRVRHRCPPYDSPDKEGDRHRACYTRIAGSIYQQLEPQIGGASVPFAVRAVVAELP